MIFELGPNLHRKESVTFFALEVGWSTWVFTTVIRIFVYFNLRLCIRSLSTTTTTTT